MDPTEHQFTCPYCWETISMILEPMVSAQTYVEDCEVCCNPIQIRFSGDEDGLKDFEASPLQQ